MLKPFKHRFGCGRYTGVMQTKDLIVSRAESTPNISFIGIMAVVGIAAIIIMARKRE